MSTPIESNTEELREILQMVYNLPNAASGSAEPDLVIVPLAEEGFTFWQNTTDRNPGKIAFEPAKVISTYQKLLEGKDVTATISGILPLNSWEGGQYTTFKADRVAALATTTPNRLAVHFHVPHGMWFTSAPSPYAYVEYYFDVDVENGTAVLNSYSMWS